jgi:hypothetical protein
VGTGLLFSTAGFLLMGWVTPTTAAILIIVASALIGMGLGQTTAPSTTLIMTSVPRAKSGVGSAVNDLSREFGGALGIAVLGSVLSTAYQHQISSTINSVGGLPHGAGTSVYTTLAAAQNLQGPAAAHLADAAKTAFSTAFGISMVAGAMVLLLNSILVWVRQVRPEGARSEETPSTIAATRA